MDPESLTPEDLFEINAWLILVTSIYDNGARAAEFGIATPTSLIAEADAKFYFASEISRRWFESNKRWMRAENVEIISKAIESMPVASEWGAVEKLLIEK